MIEPKQHMDEPSLKGLEDLPDSLKKVLVSAIKESSQAQLRHKCLTLAVQLPALSGAHEAIEVADAFYRYIMEGKK